MKGGYACICINAKLEGNKVQLKQYVKEMNANCYVIMHEQTCSDMSYHIVDLPSLERLEGEWQHLSPDLGMDRGGKYLLTPVEG